MAAALALAALGLAACGGGHGTAAHAGRVASTVAETVLPSPASASSSSTEIVESGGDADAVSCASSQFCLAVGIGESPTSFIDRWNGTAWTAVGDSDGFRLYGVSCPSAGFCLAVGGSGGDPLVQEWNGTRWSKLTTPAPPSDSSEQLNGVSCTSATSCWIVGQASKGEQEGSILEHWNGHTFTAVAVPSETVLSNSIACWSTENCLVAGSPEDLEESNGHLTTVPAAGSSAAVTCGGGLGSCWLATEANTIRHPAGRATPAIETPQGSTAQVNAIACTGASPCWLVGRSSRSVATTAPLANAWNGSIWTALTIRGADAVAHVELQAAGCAPDGYCVAVGGGQGRGGTMASVAVVLSPAG